MANGKEIISDSIDELHDIIDDLGVFVDKVFIDAVHSFQPGEQLEEMLELIVNKSWRIIGEEYFESFLRKFDCPEIQQSITLARDLWREKKHDPMQNCSTILQQNKQHREEIQNLSDDKNLNTVKDSLGTPNISSVISKQLQSIVWEHRQGPIEPLQAVMIRLFSICGSELLSEELIEDCQRNLMQKMCFGEAMDEVKETFAFIKNLWIEHFGSA